MSWLLWVWTQIHPWAESVAGMNPRGKFRLMSYWKDKWMLCKTNHKCPQSIIYIFQISTMRLREAKSLAQVLTQLVEPGFHPYHLTATSFLFLLCCLNRFKAKRHRFGMEQGGKSSWKRWVNEWQERVRCPGNQGKSIRGKIFCTVSWCLKATCGMVVLARYQSILSRHYWGSVCTFFNLLIKILWGEMCFWAKWFGGNLSWSSPWVTVLKVTSFGWTRISQTTFVCSSKCLWVGCLVLNTY